MACNDNQFDEMELARLGIRHVEDQVFQWRVYLFSRLRDTVAGAKQAEEE